MVVVAVVAVVIAIFIITVIVVVVLVVAVAVAATVAVAVVVVVVVVVVVAAAAAAVVVVVVVVVWAAFKAAGIYLSSFLLVYHMGPQRSDRDHILSNRNDCYRLRFDNFSASRKPRQYRNTLNTKNTCLEQLLFLCALSLSFFELWTFVCDC